MRATVWLVTDTPPGRTTEEVIREQARDFNLELVAYEPGEPDDEVTVEGKEIHLRAYIEAVGWGKDQFYEWFVDPVRDELLLEGDITRRWADGYHRAWFKPRTLVALSGVLNTDTITRIARVVEDRGKTVVIQPDEQLEAEASLEHNFPMLTDYEQKEVEPKRLRLIREGTPED